MKANELKKGDKIQVLVNEPTETGISRKWQEREVIQVTRFFLWYSGSGCYRRRLSTMDELNGVFYKF